MANESSLAARYKRARKRLVDRNSFIRKQGYTVQPLPAKPDVITEESIQDLEKRNAAWIYQNATYKDTKTGTVIPGIERAKETGARSVTSRKVARNKTRARKSKRQTPTKTQAFQSEVRKQVKRIQGAIRRMAKQGIQINFEVPKVPETIKPSVLEALKELTPRKLRSRYGVMLEPTTGEVLAEGKEVNRVLRRKATEKRRLNALLPKAHGQLDKEIDELDNKISNVFRKIIEARNRGEDATTLKNEYDELRRLRTDKIHERDKPKADWDGFDEFRKRHTGERLTSDVFDRLFSNRLTSEDINLLGNTEHFSRDDVLAYQRGGMSIVDLMWRVIKRERSELSRERRRKRQRQREREERQDEFLQKYGVAEVDEVQLVKDTIERIDTEKAKEVSDTAPRMTEADKIITIVDSIEFPYVQEEVLKHYLGKVPPKKVNETDREYRDRLKDLLRRKEYEDLIPYYIEPEEGESQADYMARLTAAVEGQGYETQGSAKAKQLKEEHDRRVEELGYDPEKPVDETDRITVTEIIKFLNNHTETFIEWKYGNKAKMIRELDSMTELERRNKFQELVRELNGWEESINASHANQAELDATGYVSYDVPMTQVLEEKIKNLIAEEESTYDYNTHSLQALLDILYEYIDDVGEDAANAYYDRVEYELLVELDESLPYLLWYIETHPYLRNETELRGTFAKVARLLNGGRTLTSEQTRSIS